MAWLRTTSIASVSKSTRLKVWWRITLVPSPTSSIEKSALFWGAILLIFFIFDPYCRIFAEWILFLILWNYAEMGCRLLINFHAYKNWQYRTFIIHGSWLSNFSIWSLRYYSGRNTTWVRVKERRKSCGAHDLPIKIWNNCDLLCCTLALWGNTESCHPESQMDWGSSDCSWSVVVVTYTLTLLVDEIVDRVVLDKGIIHQNRCRRHFELSVTRSIVQFSSSLHTWSPQRTGFSRRYGKQLFFNFRSTAHMPVCEQIRNVPELR